MLGYIFHICLQFKAINLKCAIYALGSARNNHVVSHLNKGERKQREKER